MADTRLTVSISDPESGTDLQFDTQDIAAALTIAEINLARGRADIARGDCVLARLRRRGDGMGGFWEVS